MLWYGKGIRLFYLHSLAKFFLVFIFEFNASLRKCKTYIIMYPSVHWKEMAIHITLL